MSCALLPKVSAMNTTSSPSSRTPLNERVKAYQSGTEPNRLRGADCASASWVR